MSRVLDIMKWGSTLGGGEQNFLGARWVTTLLKLSPSSRRRQYALKLLSLSPHYFIDRDDPSNAGLTESEYFEAAFAQCRDSREKIYDQMVSSEIKKSDVVIDYGCGPGFLARVLARNARSVYAFDISAGALACARVLNNEENLTYLTADDAGLAKVENGGVDVVVSIAMVQHLSTAVYNAVMGNIAAKLKPGGKLILHVQLPDAVWRTEEQWRSDKSVAGRIKYRYGLHCFARSEAEHRQVVEDHGFTDVQIVPVASLVDERFDDVCEQHLLTAVRT